MGKRFVNEAFTQPVDTKRFVIFDRNESKHIADSDNLPNELPKNIEGKNALVYDTSSGSVYIWYNNMFIQTTEKPEFVTESLSPNDKKLFATVWSSMTINKRIEEITKVDATLNAAAIAQLMPNNLLDMSNYVELVEGIFANWVREGKFNRTDESKNVDAFVAWHDNVDNYRADSKKFEQICKIFSDNGSDDDTAVDVAFNKLSASDKHKVMQIAGLEFIDESLSSMGWSTKDYPLGSNVTATNVWNKSIISGTVHEVKPDTIYIKTADGAIKQAGSLSYSIDFVNEAIDMSAINPSFVLSYLLQSITEAHRQHLNSDFKDVNIAETHKILDAYYKEMPELVDAVAEQAQYDGVQIISVPTYAWSNPVYGCKELIASIDAAYEMFDNACKSDLDAIKSYLKRTVYKLTKLAGWQNVDVVFVNESIDVDSLIQTISFAFGDLTAAQIATLKLWSTTTKVPTAADSQKLLKLLNFDITHGNEESIAQCIEASFVNESADDNAKFVTVLGALKHVRANQKDSEAVKIQDIEKYIADNHSDKNITMEDIKKALDSVNDLKYDENSGDYINESALQNKSLLKVGQTVIVDGISKQGVIKELTSVNDMVNVDFNGDVYGIAISRIKQVLDNDAVVWTNESALQDKYRQFFRDKLEAYGVKSPSQLSKEDKSKFFNEIKEEWKSLKDVDESANAYEFCKKYTLLNDSKVLLDIEQVLADAKIDTQLNIDVAYNNADVDTKKKLSKLVGADFVDESKMSPRRSYIAAKKFINESFEVGQTFLLANALDDTAGHTIPANTYVKYAGIDEKSNTAILDYAGALYYVTVANLTAAVSA